MKRRFRWLFCLVAVCMVVAMLPVQALAAAQTFTDEYGTWTYEEDADGYITIISFQSARKNIVVPASIGGKPVRKLGDGVFRDRDDLTMIVIPLGITEVGKDVFSGCKNLERVELPQSLTTIGDRAFSNCEKLEKVFIPSSVTEFGEDLFVNSPVVEVSCDVDAAAAEYLKNNSEDVNSFVLIEVTTPQPVRPPVSNGGESAPSTSTPPKDPELPQNAKLVTYNFGKMIDGKREYSMVLIDMPDMDLMQYLTIANGSDTFLDEKVYEVMKNRFQLVSISQFDGKTTTDVTPVDPEVYAGVRMDSNHDGDRWNYQLYYSLNIPWTPEEHEKGCLVDMEFNVDNEMLTYSTWKGDCDWSSVKLDKNEYAGFYIDKGQAEKFYADGELVWEKDYQNASAHKYAVGGECVNISISEETDKQGNKGLWKNVSTESGDTQRFANYGEETFAEGEIHSEKYSHNVVRSGDVILSEQYREMQYDADEELVSSHDMQSTPNGDGTYTLTNKHYGKEQSWEYEEKYDVWNNATQSDEECRDVHTTTITGHLESFEYVVKADNVSDAEKEVYGDVFPNEPEEHKSDVTEKSYVENPEVHVEGTVTNLVSGTTEEYSRDFSETDMRNHTYVGETGKYVGWDWMWYTSKEDNNGDTYEWANYTVTEYRYESTTDTWTKTLVSVNSKSGTSTSLDAFKEQYFQGNLDDYDISSQKWEFDPTIESGADNWKYVEPEEGDDWDQEAAEIAMGNTTVTAGAAEIKQSEAKNELLQIGANLKDELTTDNVEETFEQGLEEISGAAEVIEQVEDVFETQTLPEANHTDNVLHTHNPDGSTETIINPDTQDGVDEPDAEEPETNVEEPEANVEVPEANVEEPETDVEEPETDVEGLEETAE